MICLALLLAAGSTPVAGIQIEPDQGTPEVPAITSEPPSQVLNLEQHSRQRFSLTCTAPDADVQLKVAWRAVSLETDGTVSDHSTTTDAVVHATWALRLVTTGAHVVEAVCYDPATGWAEQTRWVVHVEPGAQLAAV